MEDRVFMGKIKLFLLAGLISLSCIGCGNAGDLDGGNSIAPSATSVNKLVENDVKDNNDETKVPDNEDEKATKESDVKLTDEPTKGSEEKTTKEPTKEPTLSSEEKETKSPTKSPTKEPTKKPTKSPESDKDDFKKPQVDVEVRVNKILNSMSLEEKVGQMFIARCPETNAVAMVEEYMPGGYILFARDFDGKNQKEVIENISNYQDASNLTMFIGVDEEGGTVNRVSRYTQYRNKPFMSSQELFESGGMAVIKKDTVEKCNLLKELGINLNFAPVCDVSVDKNDFIYKRSFGKDASQTSKYVTNVVKVMTEQSMGAVLKHFPGYGNNVDTHTGIAIDERDYESFKESDFKPFIAGIDAGAGMVLVSHNIVKAMDTDYPASLSEKVHEILREDLGFDGVIITDDLCMEAVKAYAGDEEVAVTAVLAGNDMLCSTDFQVQIPAVIKAVKDGRILEERINESVRRILRMKVELGLL